MKSKTLAASRRIAALTILALTVAICVAAPPPHAAAQCQTLRWPLQKATPVQGDQFGRSAAISGNYVVVGAQLDDAGATDSGGAYLFDVASGALLWTFNNPTPAAADSFGVSAAISGNSVVVGAFKDDTGATNAGSAYLFDAVSGSLLRTFNNPTPALDDWFGFSVAISGNNVLVGAYLDDTGAANAGSTYLFDASTGSLLRTFNNPAPTSNDIFGSAVAISGNNVVVGAPYDDYLAADSGLVYVFDAMTGVLRWTFNNPTPGVSDYFGAAVAVEGDNIVIGAYRDDTGATDAGSAYRYDAATGLLLRTFNNPSPGINDLFGRTVAISGGEILVGAINDDMGTIDAGSAYVFDTATGSLLLTLNNPTPATGDWFGWALGISGNNVLVGAPFDDDAGTTDSGKAYIFAGLCTPSPSPSPSPTPSPSATPTMTPTATPTCDAIVAVSGLTFSPDLVVISTGQMVCWTGIFGHSVLEVAQSDWELDQAVALPGGFASGPSDSFYSHAFAAPGVYFYVCQPHASLSMKGLVVVLEPSPTPSPTPNPAKDWINYE